jgi:hypothetical protein
MLLTHIDGRRGRIQRPLTPTECSGKGRSNSARNGLLLWSGDSDQNRSALPIPAPFSGLGCGRTPFGRVAGIAATQRNCVLGLSRFQTRHCCRCAIPAASAALLGQQQEANHD